MDAFFWPLVLALVLAAIAQVLYMLEKKHGLSNASGVFALIILIALAHISFNGSEGNATSRNKTLASISSVNFDRFCDRRGHVEPENLQLNCIEVDGFRAWTFSGRMYVATMMAGRPSVDLIFDPDKLLAEASDAVIFLSKEMDERHLAIAFDQSKS